MHACFVSYLLKKILATRLCPLHVPDGDSELEHNWQCSPSMQRHASWNWIIRRLQHKHGTHPNNRCVVHIAGNVQFSRSAPLASYPTTPSLVPTFSVLHAEHRKCMSGLGTRLSTCTWTYTCMCDWCIGPSMCTHAWHLIPGSPSFLTYIEKIGESGDETNTSDNQLGCHHNTTYYERCHFLFRAHYKETYTYM